MPTTALSQPGCATEQSFRRGRLSAALWHSSAQTDAAAHNARVASVATPRAL